MKKQRKNVVLTTKNEYKGGKGFEASTVRVARYVHKGGPMSAEQLAFEKAWFAANKVDDDIDIFADDDIE